MKTTLATFENEIRKIDADWASGKVITPEIMEHREALRRAYKQTLVDERLAARDFTGALCLFGSEAVAGAIVKLAPALTDEQLRETLRDEWTRCEAHRDYRADFIELFKRVGFVTDVGDEWSQTKELPARLRGKTVTIYRGNLGEDEPVGIAWTLSKKTAEFFSKHGMSLRGQFLGLYREDGVATVWKAKADTKDVLAYFDGRGEKEVVIDPANIRGAHVCAQWRLKVPPA